ncbi:MAG TPA: hypothetical protein VK478_06800 [Gemmatimonadaceae bacterium]|nr:hypothetical protein [Gemmatimonadaceae bacterium]
MRRARLAKLLIGVMLATSGVNGCKDSSWTPSGSADLILAEIKLGGASNVAKRIDADESFGRAVMNGISTGDSVWLDVADKLTPASASAEASLSIALASALPRSPGRVLALLGPKYPVEEVCAIPFLKLESTQITAYHDEAAAALSRVDSASQLKVRDHCRTVLDDARQRRLERIDPSYIVKNKPVAPPRRTRKKPVKAQPAKAQPQVTPTDTSSSR